MALPLAYLPGSRLPCRPGCRDARRAARVAPRAAADEDGPPEVSGDWRAFRANLMAQQDGATAGAASSRNMELLRQQDPALAGEGVWAHAMEQVERGGLLLSSTRAPELLSDPRMWQLVVFVLEHGPAGSTGIILNRPAFPTVADLLDRPGVEGEVRELATAFASNAIYLGSMFRPTQMRSQRLVMLHPHAALLGQAPGGLSPCREVVPGIHLAGEVPAARAVLEGRLDPRTFRFFVGQLEWGPGQLAMELASGIWHAAACSRNLVAKQCLQLPVPLWQEVMQLMGGEYAAAAAREAQP